MQNELRCRYHVDDVEYLGAWDAVTTAGLGQEVC